MKTLSFNVDFFGIKKTITITGEELLLGINSTWDEEDRVELALGLDLNLTQGPNKLALIAKIFNKLNVHELTISQLMVLDSEVGSLARRIRDKKEEVLRKHK